MDVVHQIKIEKYREHLIEHTNFDALWETLTSDNNYDNIFPEYMIQDILSTPNGCERNERFYNIIQTCDHPLSFQTLCNALSASGQNELSLLLLSDKLVCTQVDVSKNAKYPHLPPLLRGVRVCRKPGLSSWGSHHMRDPKHAYYVQSSPRGYLLLVNMRFRMNALSDERSGSEVDVKNLRDLFTQLDYKIVEHQDLTLPEMETALHDFSHMNELSEVDSVIVFVMSHGRNPSKRKAGDPPLKSPGSESVDIELEDNQFINSNEIVEYINLSPAIRANIPKLFFFNMCRGGKVNRGIDHPHLTSSDYSGHNIADTSTQVDAKPWRLPNEALEATSFLNNVPSNIPHDDIPTDDIPYDGTSVPNNDNNNHRNEDTYDVPLCSYHDNKNSVISNEEVNTLCGCFHLGHKNKDKRKNLCVRVAIWFSEKMKCSMPALDEEVSRHPNPTPGQDSPDLVLPSDLMWAEPADPAAVTPGISRTLSKGSGQSNAGSSFKGMLQRITHRILPEPKLGDIYMGFSTLDGYNSKRHPLRGSWFVTLICEVFAEQAKNTDLESMMADVDRRMREMNDERYGTQMYVKKTEGFSKKFFFNVETAES